MKIIKDKDITIYLNNPYEITKDNQNKKVLEKLIYKILKKYNIKLNGYYDTKIYIDKNYGLIIKIKKEELEFIDYFNETSEMNIEIIKDSFLYKIEDIFSIIKILNKIIIRKYKENFYLIINNISDINLGKVLENSQIIYGEKAKKIINKSQIIKPEVIV